MRQFAISADVCPDLVTAASLINTRKFEAIVVDSALGERAPFVFERVQFSPSNQGSVTFAVVDPRAQAEFRARPNFVMQKPLTDALIGSTLKAALGLIIRDYRRYFRCALSVPVAVQIEGRAKLSCEIVNISEGGLAVNSSVAFKPGAAVKVEFALPDQPTRFEVDAEICWCDNKGRAGLHFQSLPSEQTQLLQGWLSQKIEQSLPESVARLFQKAH